MKPTTGTTHFSRGLICAAIWKPGRMEPALSSQDTLTLANEQVILSLHRSAIGEMWLWQGNCGRCSKQHWAVEVMGPFGNVALTFAIGDPTAEPNWRQLLGRVLD